MGEGADVGVDALPVDPFLVGEGVGDWPMGEDVVVREGPDEGPGEPLPIVW